MSVTGPKEPFEKGVRALAEGRAKEAVEYFETAITMERERGVVRPTMRYLSYYGLSVAMADRPTREAVRACETAASRDRFDALLLVNLGKVYLLSGQPTRALSAFERARRMDPTNPRIKRALARADRRGRPAIPFLGRDHRLNRSLGRLRSSLFSRRS